MAKLVQYTITLVVILVLLQIVGVPSVPAQLLKSFGIDIADNFLINSGVLVVAIGLVFVVSATFIALLPSVFKPQESIIVAGLCASIGTIFSGDIIALITMSQSVLVKGFLFMIFAPYLAGFWITLIAFWRGNDI